MEKTNILWLGVAGLGCGVYRAQESDQRATVCTNSKRSQVPEEPRHVEELDHGKEQVFPGQKAGGDMSLSHSGSPWGPGDWHAWPPKRCLRNADSQSAQWTTITKVYMDGEASRHVWRAHMSVWMCAAWIRSRRNSVPGVLWTECSVAHPDASRANVQHGCSVQRWTGLWLWPDELYTRFPRR